MAAGVVEALEVVDVHADEGEGGALAAGADPGTAGLPGPSLGDEQGALRATMMSGTNRGGCGFFTFTGFPATSGSPRTAAATAGCARVSGVTSTST